MEQAVECNGVLRAESKVEGFIARPQKGVSGSELMGGAFGEEGGLTRGEKHGRSF